MALKISARNIKSRPISRVWVGRYIFPAKHFSYDYFFQNARYRDFFSKITGFSIFLVSQKWENPAAFIIFYKLAFSGNILVCCLLGNLAAPPKESVLESQLRTTYARKTECSAVSTLSFYLLEELDRDSAAA